MRSTWHRLLYALVVIAATLIPRSGHAQQPSQRVIAERRAEEAALRDQVHALVPDVVDIWQQANDTRDAGRLEEAVGIYTVVLEDHPTLDQALRRRCAAYAEMGQISLALVDCRSAYELAPRPQNAATLALVFAQRSALRDAEQARSLAHAALDESSEDFVLAMHVAEVAVAIEDDELLDDAAERLLELDDDAWEAQVYASLHHAAAGHERRALRALERAREAGLEPEGYAQLRAKILGSVSPEWRWAKRIGFGLLAWLGLAVGLVGAGIGLSRRALAEAERVVDNPDVSAHASDSPLHRVYAAVMWLCCAYYYVSVPIVLVLLVVIGGGLLGLTIYVGYFSIQLIVGVGAVVLSTVYAVARALFKRPVDVPPGERLDLAEAPKLRAVLEEVADEVGTRALDRVYLVPGAELAVFERGGLLAKLRGKGERCLVLGVGLLDGLDDRALRAMLAHEHGHFSNQDTAGGNFALGVRRSIAHTAEGLAELGVADAANPAWLLLQGFNRVFLRISLGASRLQEILADRWAARAYGAAAMERGLRHAIASELRFDVHARATIDEVVAARRGLRNLYAHQPSAERSGPERIDAIVEQLFHAEPSPFASHPRPADRVRWATALNPVAPGDDARESAWSLFEDRSRIEEWMTEVVRNRVKAETGWVIPVDERERVRRTKILDN